MRYIFNKIVLIHLVLVSSVNAVAQVSSSPLSLYEIKQALNKVATEKQKDKTESDCENLNEDQSPKTKPSADCNNLKKMNVCLINSINRRDVNFILKDDEESELKQCYGADDVLISTIYKKNAEKLLDKIDTYLFSCEFSEVECLSKATLATDDEKLLYTINKSLPAKLGNYYFYKGIIAYKQKDYRKAIKTLKLAIKEKYVGAEIYELLARNYYLDNDLNNAIENYGLSIAYNRDLVIAYNNRGIAYADKKQYEQAIKDYNEAIRLKPDYARAYNNRGNIYILYKNKEKYELAIKDYKEAIRLKPDYAEAYYNRGIAYANREQYELAINDYTEAIKFKPDYAKAYYNRGIVYSIYKKKEIQLAINDYTEAIKFKPDYAKAYNNRGNAYADNGDYVSAIKDYTEAIKINREYAEAYRNRGLAYEALEKIEEAKADYKLYEELTGKKP